MTDVQATAAADGKKVKLAPQEQVLAWADVIGKAGEIGTMVRVVMDDLDELSDELVGNDKAHMRAYGLVVMLRNIARIADQLFIELSEGELIEPKATKS